MSFPSSNPIIKHKISELRDKNTKHKQFRELIRELGYILTLEASHDLTLEEYQLETATHSPATGYRIKQKIGLIPILRAGLGMVESALEIHPEAVVYHVGMYRDKRSLQPVEYYNKLPDDPSVDLCFVLEPMMATGGTVNATLNVLKAWGAPKIKVVSIMATTTALQQLRVSHPDVIFHVGVIDDQLSNSGIIIPGLGDAGDRQFGTQK